MANPPPNPIADEVLACPGCGGRNQRDAAECDWCGRAFRPQGRRLRPSGWQVLSTLLVLAVVLAVGALGFLNAARTVPPPRPATPTRAEAATLLPTPAVTPRVTSPLTPTPAPSSTPTPQPPTPVEARRLAQVARTGGTGVQVRAEPGVQSRSLGTLREGATVALTGAEESVAARLWREVETIDGSLRGWVSSDYLEPQP